MRGQSMELNVLNEELHMLEKEEACCERMWLEIDSFNKGELNEDGTLVSAIWYEEDARAYNLLAMKRPNDCMGTLINYCPFCGKKLPKWLDPEDWILKEYGEDYLRYTSDPKRKEPPAEFKTDEWWKKRGL